MLGLWLPPVASLGADLVGPTAPSVAAQPRPGEQPAPTRDELFLQVFKHPPPKIPISGYVMVVVDGSERQKVKAVFSQNEQEMLLEGKPVVAFLSQLLRADIVQRLERKIDGQGWLDRAALEEAGVAIAFHPRKFEVVIETSPGMREKRVRYVNAPLPDPFTVEAIRPAPVSGFLNFNLKGTTRRDTTATPASNLNQVAFAVDGAINVTGVVVEGSAFGQTGDGRLVQRGDIRLVYDRPQRALRFTAGDLNYPSVGYQQFVNMLGIGVSKDFSLQPHVPPYRTGAFDFYLERPAEVKVWANDSLVNTLQLPAGAHDIRGLMPAIGQNDMRLVIEDSAGRREVLHFSFIYNPVLLDKGRNYFSYNAGFRREFKDGGYHYDPKKPVLSASYLEGLTDETTLGAYAQADTLRALIGLKALHVFSLGTLQLDTAASRSDRGRWDVGARIEMTGAPPAKGGLRVQSQVYAEFLGRHFSSINASSSAPNDAINFGASLAVPMGREATGQLSGGFSSARRAGANDTYQAAATVTRRWGRYISSSVSLRHRRADHGGPLTELLFGLNISFSKGTGSYYAAKELESNTVSSQWDSGRSSNSTTPYGFASTRIGPDGREYVGGGGYWGNQGLAEASYTRNENDQPQGKFVRDETTVRLQSALVFANTTFALARPVLENFAIVTGQEGLARVAMKVDPDGSGGSRARSNWISPAVIGDLSNYRLRDLRIDPINPPLGATPDKLTFTLAPTYKSGFLLKLGRERRTVAVGRLVDEQREPLVNLSIEILRLDSPNEKPASTFTSRGGGFQMPDIKPGRYEIRAVSTRRWGRVTVDIPETQDGLYRLGDVVLPPEL